MMVNSGLADVWICGCRNRVRDRVKIRFRIRVMDKVGVNNKVRRCLKELITA